MTERAADPRDRQMAELAADILLDIEAVLIRPDRPFTFTSGRVSPVYVDCRKIIGFPRARRVLIDLGVDLLNRRAGVEAFDAIAGGETAGIPFAAWIAARLALPMLYVRKKPKGFGRNAQIEGDLKDGQRVLLVEDLATDGGSKLNFIHALKTAGAKVAHTFVVFHYGIFPQSIDSLKAEGVALHGLATWWDMLGAAERRGYGAAALDEVRSFLKDPNAWSRARGGKADG
ncbi:MAG: orotate phosphoribosyltransferase [Alphaproteobacteria bacterium]|nr:orotate phosphoribosyltransferase [Alphaproteobacteria bacterium]